MSDEMAVSDNVSGEEPKISVKFEATSSEEPSGVTQEPPTEPQVAESKELPVELEDKKDIVRSDIEMEIKKEDEYDIGGYNRGTKRRASIAFSDNNDDEQFKGFGLDDQNDSALAYSRLLERMEAEVSAARKSLNPLKHIMGTSSAMLKAMKRPRKDTDGSRPSSALSSRSDGDGMNTDVSKEHIARLMGTSSPVGRGRRATTEMSSPLLRAPLERGWRRELVYRAALDAHSRRVADIYYYTPQGKKLRSNREIAEHLSGTGFTLENFSFFKEPLGIDDPEKEIIRDAKVMSKRVESPVLPVAPPAAVEGKRTPKPKAPKGASPEPTPPKSPPAKIKVKSLGARLTNNSAASAQTAKQTTKKPQAATADNNNSAAWKKPRQPAPAAPVGPPAVSPAVAPTAVAPSAGPPAAGPLAVPPAAPLPLQTRPGTHPPPPALQAGRRPLQPCSMSCGRGAVPSLACAACLCLYHPACVGVIGTVRDHFLCKNCRKTGSPPPEPPPLTHKTGVTAAVPSTSTAAPAPPLPLPLPHPLPHPLRRAPAPSPAPAKALRPDKRVTLRMKVSGGGPDGERVWAVSRGAGGPGAGVGGPGAGAGGPGAGGRGPLPQSVALINGVPFIVVPRTPAPRAAQR